MVVYEKLYIEVHTNSQNIYQKNNSIELDFMKESDSHLNFSNILRDGCDINSFYNTVATYVLFESYQSHYFIVKV